MAHNYSTPYYIDRAKELKITLSDELQKNIRTIESLSNGYKEDEEDAIGLDDVTAIAIKNLVDKKTKEIEETRNTVRRGQEARKALNDRAALVGLPAGSSLQDIENAEADIGALKKRAKAARLPENSSKEDIEKAEKTKGDLSKRAKKVGLSEDADEAAIVEAEGTDSARKENIEKYGLKADASDDDIANAIKEAGAKEDEEARDKLPDDERVLANLYAGGKKTPSVADLHAAGFNLGMSGPMGPSGCTVGKYKLHRSNVFSKIFDLTKVDG